MNTRDHTDFNNIEIPTLDLVDESSVKCITSGLDQHQREITPKSEQFKRITGIESEFRLERELIHENIDDAFDDDGFEYPENNRKGWVVVLGAFFGLLPTWGIPNSIGVIQTHVLENQLANVSTSTVSWIFSINSCLFMLGNIFSGTYFDRNGTKWPIFIGTSLTFGSLMAVGNCTKVYEFILSFGVGLGLGSGIVMAPIIGAVSHYFPKKKRALAIAIAGSGGCVGGVLFPIMLKNSYSSIGFKWSMRCVAFIDLFCLVISFLLVKERILSEKVPLTIKETIKLYSLKSFDFNALITDKRYLYCVIGSVLGELSVVIINSYFSFICVKNGFTAAESFLFVTVLNVSAVVGRYLSGIAADKWFGSYNIIIALLIITSINNLSIWLPFKSKDPAMWVYSTMYGFFYGGIYSLIPNCCSQIVRVDEFGSRYATMYAVGGICFLGMIPASSAILANGSSNVRTDGFIAFVSILNLLGAGFYFVSRTMTVGLSWRKF